MFSFTADLSSFHSVCVAKERALAEAQRKLKEATREVHASEYEFLRLKEEEKAYEDEGNAVRGGLKKLKKGVRGETVAQQTITTSTPANAATKTAEHKAPLRKSERPGQVAAAEARVAELKDQIEALGHEIAAGKDEAGKARAGKAAAEARRAAALAAREKERDEATKAKRAAAAAAEALGKEQGRAGELRGEEGKKSQAKSAVAAEIKTLEAMAAAAEEAAAKARAEADKLVKDAEAAAEAKVAAARAKAEVTKAQLEKVKEERAGIKLSTDAAKAKTAQLQAEVDEMKAKEAEARKKLDDEKKAVAAASKNKEKLTTEQAEAVKKREDAEAYKNEEVGAIAEKRRQRKEERPLLEQRLAAAQADAARQEAQGRWLQRVAAAVAREGGQEEGEGGGAVQIGELEGEEAVPEVREQLVKRARAREALAAALEEQAAKRAVLEREGDEDTMVDGEGGGVVGEEEEEEEADGPEAAALAAGEVALATLEAQAAVREAALKASARVLVAAGEGGAEEEGEAVAEESKGRESVDGEEGRRRGSAAEARKSVRFSEPLDNRAETERLAAYRAECDEGCQQAVRALEQELKALDMAVAAQEEAAERDVAGEMAEVDEALSGLREEKAAVLRKLKQLKA